MQKFEMLANLPEVKNNPTLAEFVAHEMELLAKKNATEKKPTAKQTANATIQANVLEVMSADPDRLFTITELCKEVPDLPEDMTNQRMSALVRQLVPEQVERVEDKRKAFFRIAQ
jgi:hypothetical protein